MEEKNYVKREKIYRNIKTVASLVLCLSMVVAIFMWMAFNDFGTYTEMFKKIYFLLDIALFLAIASGTCLMLLPFIKALNEGKDKPICITMIVLSAVCCLIWLIDFILRIVMLKDMTSLDGISGLPGKFDFVRISLICSIQLLPFVCVFMYYVRYRKTKIFLQISSAVSVVAVDVLFSYVVARSLLSDSGYVIFYFKVNWVYLIYAIAPLAFVISVGQGVYKKIEQRNKAEGEHAEAPVQDVFASVSSTVAGKETAEPAETERVIVPTPVQTVNKKPVEETVKADTVKIKPEPAPVEPPVQTVNKEPVEAKGVETAKSSGTEKSLHDKIKELKQMLDEGLITEEAYAKKRDDLIDKL